MQTITRPFHSLVRLSYEIIGSAILVLSCAWVDGQAANFELVWFDEFDLPGLPDPDKWDYDVGGSGWGNNELQYYNRDRLENARVENGSLIIEARKEDFGGRNYTSARLVSRGKGDWTYGRFEIRAKLPRGRGTWPAIWMLPTDWIYGGWPSSGEIDIMEHVGYDMNIVHGTIHTGDFNGLFGNQIGSAIFSPNADTEYHVYAMEWRPNRIDGFIDGLRYFTVSNPGSGSGAWPFDQRFHLLMNIAVGGNWGGAQGVDDSIFPQRMEIDYVRVYEIADFAAAEPIPIPGRLEAEAFSNQMGIRLEPTGDDVNGVNAGYLDDGDWMEFFIEVPEAGKYRVDLRYASPGGTADLEITIDTPAQSLLGSNLNATGGWQNWQTANTGELTLAVGTTALRLVSHVSGSADLNINWIEIIPSTAGDWAGFSVIDDWADTGSFLGIVNVRFSPWIYVTDLETFIWILEEDAIASATSGGAWGYITRE